MDNAPLTIGIWVHYPKKNKFSCLLTIYIAFFEHSIIKNTSSPRCAMKMIFEKQNKKLTLKKLLIYDFLCVTVWRICFPYISTLLLENSQNIAFPSQVKKISFGVHIFFFATIYSYLLYFLCMVRNKDFFRNFICTTT